LTRASSGFLISVIVLELNLIAVKLGKEEALIDLLWWFVVLGTALYLQMYKKSYRIKLNSEMFKKKKNC
jgi:hypothetical protein